MGAGFQELFSFLGPHTLKSLTQLTTASIGAFQDEVFMGPGRTPEARSESLSSLTLFHLPNVRRLSLNIPKPLEGRKFVWPDMTSPPVNIYLTSLELAFTFLDEHDLAHVLKTCPRLRSLKYDLWTTVKDDEVTETEEAIVRLSALQQALLPVKTTLETFHLHIEKYHWASGSWNEYWEHTIGHMSFHDFPRLSTLHVPLQVLLGDRTATRDLKATLRRSLINLRINLDGFDFPEEDCPGNSPVYGDEAILSTMMDLFDHRQICTPSLQILKILVGQVDRLVLDQWDADLLANVLEPRGIEVGVDVVVDMVMWRNSAYASDTFHPLARQLPPYFDQETIDKYRVLEKGPNAQDHRYFRMMQFLGQGGQDSRLWKHYSRQSMRSKALYGSPRIDKIRYQALLSAQSLIF